MLASEFDSYHQSLYESAEVGLSGLNNKKILFTGMTGFLGLPLMDILIYYLIKYPGRFDLYVVTRNISIFKKKLACACLVKNIIDIDIDNYIHLIEGDLRFIDIPEVNYDFIVHGASTSNYEKFAGESDLNRFNFITSSARKVIDLAHKINCKRTILLSSGAVYGKTSLKERIDEGCLMSPDLLNDSESCYSEAKRYAEKLFILDGESRSTEVVILRGFSFCGPYLEKPLHFSFSDFIIKALYGKDIILRHDKEIFRSYMYNYDFALYLLKAMYLPVKIGIFNIGSEDEISIKCLAELVRGKINKNINILIGESESIGTLQSAGDYYVPNVGLLNKYFSENRLTSLDKAVELTAHWQSINKQILSA